MGEGVDDRRPDVGFVHWSLEGSRVKAVAHLLQAVHHVLGEATPVIAALVLPASKSLGRDVLEDGIARVVVSPRDRTVAWRNGDMRVPLGDRRMATVAVVGAIGIATSLRAILYRSCLFPGYT